MARLLPPSATPVARRIVVGRAARGFADGFVSVLLAQYLTDLGFSPIRIGAIVTATLLGSAVLTLAFGFSARRIGLVRLLGAAAVLMAATGLGFAAFTDFWPLLVVATIGTLNPSAGDVSAFLPTEQAYVTGQVEPSERPALFAAYNLSGIAAGAVGALLSGTPERIADALDRSVTDVQRGGFVLYAVVAVGVFVAYRGLPDEDLAPAPALADPATDPATGGRPRLRTSRRTVYELAALFSLDSAGSGFVVTSLLVLWLHLRFDLSAGATGGVFFAAGLLGACSQLLAPWLAARIGLVRTMAFTHLPANALLALTAFAPNGAVAITLLLVRALFAQMDVPARQAFVMAVVPPEDRATASSITNVPRSLASATTPLLAGALLAHSDFGWPLLIAGATKFTYDLILLFRYRHTPEAVAA